MKSMNSRGFSLAEVLVAFVLLAMVTLGFTSSFVFMEKSNVPNQHQLQAVNFARETLEDLEIPTRDYASDPDLSLGTHTTGTATLLLSLPANTGMQGASRSYEVAEHKETLGGVETVIGKKITVTVSWSEDGEAKQERLFGLVVQK